MNGIQKWISALNKGVTKMKITGLPRLFLLLYAGIFISIGSLYLVGLLLEFWKTGNVNYPAVNQFAGTYFGVAVVGTFCVLGKALVDKDEDGIPDTWELENKERPGPPAPKRVENDCRPRQNQTEGGKNADDGDGEKEGHESERKDV